ncbi:hypothetical protein [Aeromonas schubertii]|uniref:hypothetical protein n=1 Tax=Aeromonas schubertii TaxID=652 RepID=UPI0029CA504F|nr:hypothetical protein [Aeromonas schubertii]
MLFSLVRGSRPLLILLSVLALPLCAAEPDQTREPLHLTSDELLAPWRGDLPGMIERRVIRVLTSYSKTFYFIDKGRQRGPPMTV